MRKIQVSTFLTYGLVQRALATAVESYQQGLIDFSKEKDGKKSAWSPKKRK